jgi:hypothetical protein
MIHPNRRRLTLTSEIQIRVCIKREIRRHWPYRQEPYFRKEIRELITAYREITSDELLYNL